MSKQPYLKKYKAILITLIVMIVLANTPPAQYFLLPNYQYQNRDGSFRYSEEPGKGMDFKAGQIQFEAWKKQNKNNPNQTLHRNFPKRPWAFWEWWQYIAHGKRFKLSPSQRLSKKTSILILTK